MGIVANDSGTSIRIPVVPSDLTGTIPAIGTSSYLLTILRSSTSGLPLLSEVGCLWGPFLSTRRDLCPEDISLRVEEPLLLWSRRTRAPALRAPRFEEGRRQRRSLSVPPILYSLLHFVRPLRDTCRVWVYRLAGARTIPPGESGYHTRTRQIHRSDRTRCNKPIKGKGSGRSKRPSSKRAQRGRPVTLGSQHH